MNCVYLQLLAQCRLGFFLFSSSEFPFQTDNGKIILKDLTECRVLISEAFSSGISNVIIGCVIF